MKRGSVITRQRTVVIALVSVVSLTGAACGQKTGVGSAVVAGTDSGQVFAEGTVIDPTTGTALPGAGTGTGTGPGAGQGSGTGAASSLPAGGSGAASSLPAGGSGAATGTTTTGGGKKGEKGAGKGDGSGTTSTPTPTQAPVAAGDTTGVTDTTIKIGVHAPVTGAAAIPSTSFERGVGAYFDYVNKRGGIFGRQVEVHFEDDKFDPATAVQKCKHLVETLGVFMLFGGAGSDQIEACARYAGAAGVPYMSAGVHERSTRGALGDLPTYFAGSLSYEQQAPLVTRIAQQVAQGGKKVTLRVANNTSLDNYYNVQAQSLAKALGASFLDPGGNGRIPKDTSGGDALDVATKICNSGAEVVVWNASPSSLLNASAAMPCFVTFVGPGLSNGLNIVTTAGCPKLEGARFLSPFPGMDRMRQNKEFTTAYAEKNGGAAPDDLGAAMFGGEKLIAAVIQAVGKALDRQSFMNAIAQQKVFKTGVYPDTNFSSRFGGTAMWDLKADCGKGEYVTMGLLAP